MEMSPHPDHYRVQRYGQKQPTDYMCMLANQYTFVDVFGAADACLPMKNISAQYVVMMDAPLHEVAITFYDAHYSRGPQYNAYSDFADLNDSMAPVKADSNVLEVPTE